MGSNSPLFTYHENGNIKTEIWKNNLPFGLHRENDLPAWNSYYENGIKNSEEWRKNGSFYKRENNLPNRILYNPKGIKKEEIWYDETGNYHREEEPSYIEYYENGNKRRERWFKNNKHITTSWSPNLHREGNLPAWIDYDENENGNKEREMWYENGERLQKIEYEYANQNNSNCIIM